MDREDRVLSPAAHTLTEALRAAGELPLVAFFRFGLAQPEKAYVLSEAPRGWAGTVFVARLGGRELSFSPDGRRGFIERVTGSRFDAFGRGVSGPLAGRTLRSVPQVTAFWFSWFHFYPETRVAPGPPG